MVAAGTAGAAHRGAVSPVRGRKPAALARSVEVGLRPLGRGSSRSQVVVG